MKIKMHRYLISLILLLIYLNGIGQPASQDLQSNTRVLLNELKKNEKIALQEEVVNISMTSRRAELLICRILKGNVIKKEIRIQLEYGLNKADIILNELGRELQEGEVFVFQFEGQYFGKGSFDFYLKNPPILVGPTAIIQVDPSEIHCDDVQISSIDFLGKVTGGTAPYQITWLISNGPLIKDLINYPIRFELKNDQEASTITVTEKLNYYVTLLIEDACGNQDKKVMHLKCDEDDEDGMLYFQPIDILDRSKYSNN